MNPFVTQRVALTLDALGQRYGCRPSQVVGMRPELGASVLFDLRVLEMIVKYEKESETVGGKIAQKRAAWSPKLKRELRSQGLLR